MYQIKKQQPGNRFTAIADSIIYIRTCQGDSLLTGVHPLTRLGNT